MPGRARREAQNSMLANGREHATCRAWQQNFVTVANGNLAGLGLVAGDRTPLAAAQTTWAAACPARVTAAAATASTRPGHSPAPASRRCPSGRPPGLLSLLDML